MVRWVSAQADRLPDWEDSWVRLLHLSADLRCETRRLLGSQRRPPPADAAPVVRVGERRSERVAAGLTTVAAVAASPPQGGGGGGGGISDGGDSSGSGEGEAAGAEAEGFAVAEVREWKRDRGRLLGLGRWEPDPVLGEFPLEWKGEKDLGAH